MTAPVRVAILGSTGSIGRQALDVAARYPERIEVVALAAGSDEAALAEQIRTHRPVCAALADPQAADRLRTRLGDDAPEIMSGEEGVCAVAADPRTDVVLSAIVGFAGLAPTLAACAAGKRVALANKESLAAAGALVMATAARYQAEIIPVDSEHSAIFQCLQGVAREQIDRLILTASGGPLRTRPLDTLESVTPQEAVAHPTWTMGPKISVDSATLMNKGLEVIEARWLFDWPAERIEVRIHPQSVVHSLVALSDGALLAQAGAPDMRGPIGYALSYPERLPGLLPFPAQTLGTWEFFEPEASRYKCLWLAYDALEAGAGYPAALNAANEVSVAEFLNGNLPFTRIASTNGEVLRRAVAARLGEGADSLADVRAIDAWARREAVRVIRSR